MSPSVLVYGWYNHGNVGDELFRESFKVLFPGANLEFSDRLTEKNLTGKSAVVFGGGSFLYKAPWADLRALNILQNIPTAYIGVGVEDVVDDVHLRLMKKSKFVAVRTVLGVNFFRSGHSVHAGETKSFKNREKHFGSSEC